MLADRTGGQGGGRDLGAAEPPAEASANAGAQAVRLEVPSGEMQQVQQLGYQLADCRGASVAELQAVQGQLASLEPRC